MSRKASLLGERLVQRGVITREQLAQALALQQQAGGQVGEILYTMGACNSLALHEEIAAQQAVPFANLLTHPPDPGLLNENSLGEYLFLDVLPWKRDTASAEVLIATPHPDFQVQAWAARYFPKHRFVLTSRLDIHRSLMRQFSSVFSRLSRERLRELMPQASARETLQRRQRHWFWGILAAVAVGIYAAPVTGFLMLLLLVNGFYVLTLGFKTLIFVQGMRHRERLWRHLRHVPRVPDHACPIYTILIPLYREVEVLPQIIAHMQAMDYPPNRLDIKLVIEADDAPTLAAAKALQPAGNFEIIEVPPSLPRTKPKACNYALRFARGEYLTIYDAEDKPDPKQLRRVLQRFHAALPEVVCVQCRLNYYNRNDNLLTRLFALEYAAWFDYMLPGLESLNLPIPLGGTSNHIALKRLMELGEWDPYNVTEDADLGIRMAVAKYRTLTHFSITQEEAPVHLRMWLNQRSRWVKGYMQTWLVHMRRPRRLYQQLGARAFWGFQFFIGGPCLVFLTTPLLITVALGWAVSGFTLAHPLLPIVGLVSFLSFSYGLVLHSFFACRVLRDTRWQRMNLALISFPYYWLLHSLASFKGLWQLITRPHYWEKTEHGVSTQPTDIKHLKKQSTPSYRP